MIIHLEENIAPSKKSGIINKIKELGYQSTEVKAGDGNYLVCMGTKEFDIGIIGGMDGVANVQAVSDHYKLVSRKWKSKPSEIELMDGISIKQGDLTLMAGPCSIENESQALKVVDHLVKNKIKIMRGGVFKPRSSPYAFRGLGLEGLKMLSAICKNHGIKIISEVMEVSQIALMYDYIDIYQVGARNSQNFNLLDELGKVDKPVLIKRGISGTIDELLHSAEHIFANGNEKLILCERGIRTYETAYRNTFDINAIPILKAKTHLPVIADPSHGIGLRRYIEPIALAAIMAGADGVIYEVHEKPEEAKSDGQQTLNFTESDAMIDKVRKTFALRESFNK